MSEMKDKIKRGLAVSLSNLAKRMMESQYDRLTETEIGQKLRGLDKKYLYGIEAGLDALGAVIEQIIPEDNSVVMFFKQILEDAPPEIAKRLVNGVKDGLQLKAQNAKTKEEKMAIMSLLKLDDESLKEILCWFGSMDPSERTHAAGVVCNLASSELKRMAALSPEERKLLVDIQNPPPPPHEQSELVSKIESDLNSLANRIDKKRTTLQEKKGLPSVWDVVKKLKRQNQKNGESAH